MKKQVILVGVLVIFALALPVFAQMQMPELSSKTIDMSKEKVIEIAKNFAKEKNIDLANYPNVDAQLNSETNVWDVSMGMEPITPGGTIQVLVDAGNGQVKDIIYGE